MDADQRSAVASMVSTAPAAAANPPLNEQGLLNLQATHGVRHLLAVRAGRLIGYAQLTASDDEIGAELVTAGDAEPSVADELLRAARDSAHGKLFRLWAHGKQSVAARAADTAGLTPMRSLLQLRRPVDAGPLPPAPPLADGVVIRSFVPGQDDAAWLRVNSRAFASHPEQGKWTQHELDERLAADWFDPAGFLLADRAGEVLGYHWTKLHAELDPPLGEVYVIGVDPAASGLRLGRPLLNAGLEYLAGRGVPAVLLYVESDNTRAIGLYESAGFTTFSTDTQYAAP
ncbi:MAG: mycothiol synthase [Frankiales bacterium]|nr:mycothiol synthase [Frankiales bacterium]